MGNTFLKIRMENEIKHREIKILTANKRRNYLVSALLYTKIFFGKFTSNRNKKTKYYK